MKEKLKIKIESEIGELEGVILHKPGKEIENLTPVNAKRALYSDILNLSVASKEYAQFSDVLEKVTKVFYLDDLLATILDNQDTKNTLVNKITENCKYPEINSFLLEQDSKHLAQLLIEGVPLPKNTLSTFLSKETYVLQPLHNFFFMRDSSSAVLDAVLINRMANEVRRREAVIMQSIFENHPQLITNTYNPELSRYYTNEIMMEGGDIQVASKDVLVIGMGARTSAQGIDYIAKKIESREFPRHVIIQELPHFPESFIHLDMVFTFLDRDKCMIYEPLLKSKKYATIKMVVDNGKIKSISEEDNLIDALKSVKINLKPILCGGSNPQIQEREQWHSGANFFAFAPGKIIGYERNTHTIEELNKNGFEVVSAKEINAGKVDLSKLKKVVVTIHGAELSRGGGGARCMTMPLRRKDI